MKFEGSEKKLEMITHPQSKSLRGYPESFFNRLLKISRTRCVCQFSNAYCTAYVLSESSLFVWDHRLLLITCGQTTLASAGIYLIKHIKEKNIQAFFFQRKNEFFPMDQKSDFFEDTKRLNKKIRGKAYQFGNLDEHYFYLFHLDKKFSSKPDDQTVEILMYGLRGRLAHLLNQGAEAKKIREYLKLDQSFPGFTIQDHIFQPRGYSLNGLKDRQYFTIHATPQERSFYISFETNINETVQSIVNKILILFQPCSFDIITFTSAVQTDFFKKGILKYIRTAFYKRQLECGFDVSFSSFKTGQNQPQNVFELK